MIDAPAIQINLESINNVYRSPKRNAQWNTVESETLCRCVCVCVAWSSIFASSLCGSTTVASETWPRTVAL